MQRFIDVEKVELKGLAIFDENLDVLIPLSEVRKALQMTPTEDVVPKSEVDKLELTLQGVMWSVDKWLDEADYDANPINRAATMREKTLQIIEDAKIASEEYQHNWQKIHDSYTADCQEHYNKGRSEVAREIFAELETKAPFFCENQIAYDHFNEELADLKKKYTDQP